MLKSLYVVLPTIRDWLALVKCKHRLFNKNIYLFKKYYNKVLKDISEIILC